MRTIVAVLAVAVLSIAGCGGSDEKLAGDESGVVTMDVGTTGIATDAALRLGMEKGFFDEERIRVRHRIAGGGAALVPGLVAGEYDVGGGNFISVFQANERGLPIQIVAGVNEAQTTERADQDIAALVVPKGSDIRSARQLAGTTIAINSLKNLGDLTVSATLDKRGVDSGSVKFTEVDFPDMLTALESGDIDAAWMLEPFVTLAGDQVRVIARPFVETAPRFPLGGFFVAKTFADRNPDAVRRFVRGYARSVDYAAAHPDEQRRIIPTFTKIPPKVANRMPLPNLSSEVNVGRLRGELDLARRYGLVKKPLDVEALIRR